MKISLWLIEKRHACLAGVVFVCACVSILDDSKFELKESGQKRWYKGNTHMHTLWSDGDAAPEVAVQYYKDRGYNFISVSDHNTLWEGERWFPIDSSDEERLTGERLESIKRIFGQAWPEVRQNRQNDDRWEMRLKTIEEIRPLLEDPERFRIIHGEEISSSHSVHVNGINLARTIPPASGDSKASILQMNLDAVARQSEELDRPMVAHINHPNFGSRVTAEDIMATRGARFFEVFNGHGEVNNWGDPTAGLPSTDRLWDILLAMRLSEGSEGPIYGVGTDDTHQYFEHKPGNISGGRGFIVVLARSLSTDDIVEAIDRGDFYSSSGVIVDAIQVTSKDFRIRIKEDFGIFYTTQFIGTREKFDRTSDIRLDQGGQAIPGVSRRYSKEVGQVLLETTENPAVYRLQGDELYVRARIVSSKPHPNPFTLGDREMAWTQPVVPD